MCRICVNIMFTDKSFQVLGFNSSWKTERTCKEAEVQTAECIYKEEETQCSSSAAIEVQTDDMQPELVMAQDVDYDKLATFLRRVSPKVIKVLDEIHRSRAFQGYEPLEDFQHGNAKKLHTLLVPSVRSENKVKVSSMSWSCTGAVIAFANSYVEHDDWCDHNSNIYLFNTNRPEVDPAKPTRVLETRCCVTNIAAHPIEPSVIAAGTVTGEILVWNLQNDDDGLIASSATVPGAHKEAITQLSWVRNPDPTQQRPLLVSAGSDGRILMWHVGSHSQNLHLNAGFAICMEHNRYSGARKTLPSPISAAGMDLELGANCFSFAVRDLSTFIVGTDGGGILHCSTLTSKPSTVRSDVPLKDPVLSAFERHQGPVTCVQFSPHHDGTFLSCASDNEIRVYHMKQAAPLKTVHVESGVLGVEWNPLQTSFFAAWGATGKVNLYKLSTGEVVSFLQLPETQKPAPISAMRFNPKSPLVAAVGDVLGRVVIWQLNKGNEELST